jgi:hypothetical protein
LPDETEKGLGCVKPSLIKNTIYKFMEIDMKNLSTAAALMALLATTAVADEYIGNYSANKYNANSTSNPNGAGSPYNANSINNPNGTYGSPYSSKSATNPYATDAPKMYDKQGNYRGKLSSNPYDAESTSNPYGRYGSPYSSESINNPYGAGSRYRSDSPNNPYGQGLEIYGE